MALIRELRDELDIQWGRNHAEYCGMEWPHRSPGRRRRCPYPPPRVLADASEFLLELQEREGSHPLAFGDDGSDVDALAAERD